MTTTENKLIKYTKTKGGKKKQNKTRNRRNGRKNRHKGKGPRAHAKGQAGYSRAGPHQMLLDNALAYVAQLHDPLRRDARYPSSDVVPSTIVSTFKRWFPGYISDTVSGEKWLGVSAFPWINANYTTLTAINSTVPSESWTPSFCNPTLQSTFVTNFAMMRFLAGYINIKNTGSVSTRDGVLYVARYLASATNASLTVTDKMQNSPACMTFDLALIPEEGLTFNLFPLGLEMVASGATGSCAPSATTWTIPTATANAAFYDNNIGIWVQSNTAATLNAVQLELYLKHEAIPYLATAPLFDLKAVAGSPGAIVEAMYAAGDVTQGLLETHASSGDSFFNRAYGYLSGGTNFLKEVASAHPQFMTRLAAISMNKLAQRYSMSSITSQLMDAPDVDYKRRVIDSLAELQIRDPEAYQTFMDEVSLGQDSYSQVSAPPQRDEHDDNKRPVHRVDSRPPFKRDLTAFGCVAHTRFAPLRICWAFGLRNMGHATSPRSV